MFGQGSHPALYVNGHVAGGENASLASENVFTNSHLLGVET
jgi:hypothetical protein